MSVLTLRPPSAGRAPLPPPRGPLSAFLLDRLQWAPHRLVDPPPLSSDVLDDDDFQGALQCCYELHYQGLVGVDDAWEWEPSLLAWRAELETAFEAALNNKVPRTPAFADEVVGALGAMASDLGGPSLSGWALEQRLSPSLLK